MVTGGEPNFVGTWQVYVSAGANDVNSCSGTDPIKDPERCILLSPCRSARFHLDVCLPFSCEAEQSICGGLGSWVIRNNFTDFCKIN